MGSYTKAVPKIDIFASKKECLEYKRSKNIIVDLESLLQLLKAFAKCKNCGKTDSFDVVEENTSRKGLAVSLMYLCTACGHSISAMTSKISRNYYDINIRLIYAMCCIGKGNKAAETFCSVMNLPPPPTNFQKYNKLLLLALSEVANNSTMHAVKETVEDNSGDTDIPAAFDGTWQKHGRSSLNGIVCATSLSNEKIIDFECLTKYCPLCKNKLIGVHDCMKNFEGYSEGMEVEGVLKIFQRSESSREVRYVKYLGDGDSRGYKKVCEENVYRSDCGIEKLECIAHVQKRMGTKLKNIRSEMESEKLADGKGISGRGRLTDAEIMRIQTYYGLPIHRSINMSLDEMVRSIWAIYLHKLSSNENPQHGLCPRDPETWCGHNKSLITGEKYSHKHSLPESVLLAVKDVFRSLSDKKLLSKCMHSRTQNPNESFNNCIWLRIPKTVFMTLRTLKLCVLDAVICFNDGAHSRIRVMDALGIEAGHFMVHSLQKIDRRGVCEAALRYQKLYKLARMKIKVTKQKQHDTQMLNQSDYGAGRF